MPARQFGTLTKTSVDAHSSVTQSEFGPGSDAVIDDLGEPLPPDVDSIEATLVDGVLLGYEIGDLTPLPPDKDDPLVIDIDDGRPDPPRNRLGALKRVDTSVRTMSKFNRHTGVWE